ncbi:ABATE domain-containing protein [Isoptericola sp. F-RaC21]|uniref:CGNR zinc finger domain-containing protein n=1 Tax=Isoptericola sp. F-RaC21 TaxID=3141452 RepID=UPI00315BEF15
MTSTEPLTRRIARVLLDEPLPIDLVNTHMYLAETWVDLLDSRDDRDEWLRTIAPRLDADGRETATLTDDAAAALKGVREHAAAAIEPARHGKRPPARALAGLNDALRAAPVTTHARWGGSSVVTRARRDGNPAERLAAAFADATVQLLSGPDIVDVRRCDAPACVMLFLPRNPRRRWCTPDVCGNRARVARYYLRHKSENGDAASPR